MPSSFCVGGVEEGCLWLSRLMKLCIIKKKRKKKKKFLSNLGIPFWHVIVHFGGELRIIRLVVVRFIENYMVVVVVP